MKENIKINNKNYILDCDRAKELGVLIEVGPHKMGNFYIDNTGERWILSLIFSRQQKTYMTLICLTDGGRWDDGFPVKNPMNITSEEWKSIAPGPRIFTPILLKIDNIVDKSVNS